LMPILTITLGLQVRSIFSGLFGSTIMY
jgi:hypothetical protein